MKIKHKMLNRILFSKLSSKAILLKLVLIIKIVMLLALLTFLSGCAAQKNVLPVENGTIEVLFSKQDDCGSKLEKLITSSKKVRAALYDLDSQKLMKALIDQRAELIIDEDQYSGIGQKISGAGLMHNKFWVFYNITGKDYIATGSLNPTQNDLLKNDNNLVIVSSEYLKKNYEAEFEELRNNWKDKPTIYKKIIFNGKLLENYFCPEDSCEDKILDALKKARKNIYFMTFSFTSDNIGEYIISRKDELDIKGVFDESQYKSQKQYSEYEKMLDKGLDVRLDGNPSKMHHKVFIIDREVVITGSYNPTGAGNTRNDENILIIHDQTTADFFIKEFERVWGLAKK